MVSGLKKGALILCLIQVRLVFRRWCAHINWDEGAWSRGQRGGDSLTDRGLPSFMAATGGCPGLVGDELKTEESGDPVPVPNKRKKIQVAATELDGVSKISTEEKKQTGRMSTAAAEKYPSPHQLTPSAPHLLFASGHTPRLAR